MEKQVDDYHEMALVVAKGFKIQRAEHDAGSNRVLVWFEDGQGALDELLTQYRVGQVEVNALDFTEALDRVKTLIFKTRPRRDDRPRFAPSTNDDRPASHKIVPGGSGHFAPGSRGFEDSERGRRGGGDR